MILDAGIATIFKAVNAAEPGNKPDMQYVPFHLSAYGELNFSTESRYPTEGREEVRTDARIRILQNRMINNLCRVELTPGGSEDILLYRVTRAYHGRDDDAGELITDLNMEAITP